MNFKKEKEQVWRKKMFVTFIYLCFFRYILLTLSFHLQIMEDVPAPPKSAFIYIYNIQRNLFDQTLCYYVHVCVSNLKTSSLRVTRRRSTTSRRHSRYRNILSPSPPDGSLYISQAYDGTDVLFERYKHQALSELLSDRCSIVCFRTDTAYPPPVESNSCGESFAR